MEHFGPGEEISPTSRSSRGSVGSSFAKSDSRARSTYHRAVFAGSSRFSHPRPAPPPPAEHSSPASPVIANSAFAHLDYFSAARPASSPLVKRSNTIATRTVTTYPTMPLVDEIDLASPRVLDSPEMTSTKRRTVQFGERSNVNWARPLRSAMPILEERPASPVRLLGTSMQRSRRLAKPPVLDTPSPCSSLDESPKTPTTPDSAPALRSWTLPTVADVKGLGFGPELDWNSSASGSTTSESGSALADYLESNSPTASSGTPTPRHSRILSTSESLIELSSPSTLDELRHLRQAALDLQAEALPHRRSSPTETIQARRIKRKAVPSFNVDEVEVTPLPSSESSAPMTFLKPMRVLSTVLPPPSLSPPSSRSSSLASSPSLPLSISPGSSSSGSPRKAFYANMSGTRSVIEISPRTSSLPFRSTHQRKASQLSSSSSSTSDADEPITPGATTERDTFALQVEAGLRALNMSAIDLGSFANDGTKKHKRGLSRFFRKTPTDL